MLKILSTLIPVSLRKAIKLQLHKGNTYTCPLCQFSSKDLSKLGSDLPVLRQKQVIGGGLRLGGCFSCGANDREKLIYLFLKDKTELFASSAKMRVLHIAPERRIAAQLLELNLLEYVCGDLYVAEYNYPDYVQNMDVLDIPYPDNHFDIILCNHVLEHIPADLDAMKSLCRVLKPGCKALLQVPISANSTTTDEDFTITDPKILEQRFGQFDHVRIYGQDYVTRLTSAGFKVNRTNISAEYPKTGVNINEDLFICTK
jgi:SAM-dependent methyltransferase